MTDTANNEPVAWMHEIDPTRVVSATTLDGARRDGGAILSFLRPYNIPLVVHGQQPVSQPVTDERMAFETWAKTADMPLGMYSETDYGDGATQLSWDAWQARAALAKLTGG